MGRPCLVTVAGHLVAPGRSTDRPGAGHAAPAGLPAPRDHPRGSGRWWSCTSCSAPRCDATPAHRLSARLDEEDLLSDADLVPTTALPSARALTALVVGGVLAVSLALQVVPGGGAPAAAASSGSAGVEPAASGEASTDGRLDTAPLQALVDEAAADDVRLSVGVQSLGGATLTDGPVIVGSTEVYSSASLVKLALVTTVLRQVDRGELSLDQVETVTGADDVPGTGALAGYRHPYDATVAELAELAITVSDNTASNVLAELVGLDAVDDLVDDLDLEPTHMGRLFFSSGPRNERNVLDTASTVELMRAVHEGDVLGPASRGLLLRWMRDQQLDTKFAPALPGVPLASKTGDTSSLSHDGAYLLEPGRETVLVVLSETLDGRSPTAVADPYLAKAARLVHDQVAAAPAAPTADDAGAIEAAAVRGEPGEGAREQRRSPLALAVVLVGVVVGVLVLAVVVLRARVLLRRRRRRAAAPVRQPAPLA